MLPRGGKLTTETSVLTDKIDKMIRRAVVCTDPVESLDLLRAELLDFSRDDLLISLATILSNLNVVDSDENIKKWMFVEFVISELECFGSTI